MQHLPYPDPDRSSLGSDRDTVVAGVLDTSPLNWVTPAGGWDDIGAVVIEPVQGNEETPEGFLQGLRRVCDSHDVLLVAEVMSGFCRTGRMFAFQHEEVSPDVVASGSPCLLDFHSLDVSCRRRSKLLRRPNNESSTYAGNLVSCTAAFAALDVYEEELMSTRATVLGEHLVMQLRAVLQGHPSVGVI